MTKQRSRFVPIVMLAASILVADSVAQDPAPREGGSLELLDRGSAEAGLHGHGPAMMATLAVGAATPGVTTVGVIEVVGTMLPAYQGNFYVAPADFPTSWYPFDVTGVFAYGAMLTPPPPLGIMVGAGVAPAPFAGGGGTMWAAFTAMTYPVPAGMTPAVFGMPGSIAPGMVPVVAPNGIACGIFNDPVVGPNLGGLTSAPSTERVFTFNGPPAGDFLATGFSAFIQWVAGCYVSGATVPVELQSFHID